jgi:5-formyltetrahydrofolate cyclo-ligase
LKWQPGVHYDPAADLMTMHGFPWAVRRRRPSKATICDLPLGVAGADLGEATDSPKARLRRALDARRNGVAAEALAHASQAICERVAALPVFHVARHVVLYAGRRGEVDPASLHPLCGGRMTYYPRVEADGLVARRSGLDDLVPGRFGIPEPPASAPALASDADAVVVVVPGLGFDRRGGRLGTGKGYYDRMLPGWPQATRIGLCLDVCLVDRLPTDPWDVPMHVVVTERELLAVDAAVGVPPGDSRWT